MWRDAAATVPPPPAQLDLETSQGRAWPAPGRAAELPDARGEGVLVRELHGGAWLVRAVGGAELEIAALDLRRVNRIARNRAMGRAYDVTPQNR